MWWAVNDGILAGRRRFGSFKFRYLRLRAERARKKSDSLILKKINNKKQYLLQKIALKKLCFGDFRGGGGGGRAPGAPPLESASGNSL